MYASGARRFPVPPGTKVGIARLARADRCSGDRNPQLIATRGTPTVFFDKPTGSSLPGSHTKPTAE